MALTGSCKHSLLAIFAVALAFASTTSDQAGAQDGLFGNMSAGPHDWSGLYMGGQISGVWGDADVDFVGPSVLDNRINDVDGVMGGGHAGYNWQVQDIVFGVIGDINFGDVDGSNTNGFGSRYRTEMDFNASLRLKMGMAVADRALIYVTGGAAIAEIDHSIRFGAATQSEQSSRAGITAGGGVEYAFTDMISGFVEGRWTDYGDESEGPVPFPAHRVDLEHVQVTGGVSFHLGNLFNGGY